MITPEAVKTIRAVVAVLETGQVPNPVAYSTATILDDDAGPTYGLHQATRSSLRAILDSYLDDPACDADLAARITKASVGPWPGYAERHTPAALELLDALRAAGADPAMQRAQDHVFELRYWQPAAAMCEGMELARPLSWLAVYDTCIHSGPPRVTAIRRRFPEVPPSDGGSEGTWTEAFLLARRAWLVSSFIPGSPAAKSAWRCTTLLDLVDREEWGLERPIEVRLPGRSVVVE